jgi:polar amino acid transport system substrate-binding protein
MTARTIVRGAAVAIASSLALAACGGSSSSSDNALGTRENGVIRVASVGDAKPYTYTDSSGHFTGFDVELLKNVAGRVGLRTQFSGQDFSGLLAAVNNGQYDVGAAAIGITPARKQTVDFSDGYLVGYLSILARDGSGVTSADSLAGHRLGVTQGSLQEQYAIKHFPKAQLVRFPDNNSAIAALSSGNIDAHFLDIAAAQDYAKQRGKLTIVSNIPSFDAPAGFAVKKGNTALRAALNKGLHAAIKDGTWVRLYKRYFPSMPVPKQYTPQGAAAGSTTS